MAIRFPDQPGAVRGVRRSVPRIAEQLARTVDYWGPQCAVYERGCACCEAWRLFAESARRFPGGQCPTQTAVDAACRAAFDSRGRRHA